MGDNTAAIRVGRLLEVRADAGYKTAEQVDLLFDSIATQVGRLPAEESHITAVDWRRCPIMSPEAAQRIGQRISATNARTRRSAALARSDAHVSVLQFLRVIRDAGHPERRLFFDAAEMISWLSEVLTPSEAVRLRSFLAEATPESAPSGWG